MPYSHDGAADKINDIKQEFRWSEQKARRFHDWLTDNYRFEKNEMSYTRLREVAREFDRSDRGRWDD